MFSKYFLLLAGLFPRSWPLPHLSPEHSVAPARARAALGQCLGSEGGAWQSSRQAPSSGLPKVQAFELRQLRLVCATGTGGAGGRGVAWRAGALGVVWGYLLLFLAMISFPFPFFFN